MPTEALPIPRLPDPSAGLVAYRRVFTDVLRRPLVGSVVLTPKASSTRGEHVIAAAPAKVDLDPGGVLHVYLPPGAYELVAQLRTPEGAGVQFRDRVTLEASDD